MNDFLFFFISFLIIVFLFKNIYTPKNIIKKVSLNDNIEYIVRDLENSQEAAEKLSSINNKLKRLIESLDVNEREGIKRLKNKYNPYTLSETEENSKYTSYSLNKGEKIALCLRKNRNSLEFQDENTILFVAIHELSHIMTKSVGHEKEFWDNMAFLLEKAHELNIYDPVDYSENNVNYCGMEITTTPYDFKK
jgi:predicted metal-dependent hydrolase